MLLPLVAVFFLCFTVAASGGGSRDSRRVLHQPLYPIQWTPPPPALEFSDTPPDDSGPFFPGVPSPPTSTTQTTAGSGRQSSSASKKIVVVAASVSAAAFAAILLIGFLLYRRRRLGMSLDTGKFIGLDDSGSRREASASSAAPPNFLYLGTVDTASSRRRSEEENGSPYRKLGTERVLEMHHPSPDLQPLPPLSTMTTRNGKIPLPTASSDEDTFYTPLRSVASATSEGPSSPVSRRSLPSMSSGGKEFLAAAVADSGPRSRRSSPPMQLADYPNSEVKQMIPATKRQPPPPPPPPPPPTRLLNTIRNPPPPPPPPPQATESSRKKDRSVKATPIPPTSRRRLLNPLPPEATRLNIPLPPSQIDNGFTASSSHQAEELGKNLDSKPKLKPLHWDKVKATSDRAMVWDQLKSSSFTLNEDVIETLFINNATSSLPKDASRRQGVLSSKQETSVLDPKKSQNIAILLRALNVTRDEVSEALLDGNPEFLGVELLETLVKMAPTKEEELKLRDYTGNISKLGSAERFMKAVLDIPFAFKRVDAMLYRANFETEVNYLMKSFETLEAACDDLRSSKLFLKLLEAVLRTGNRMNVGTKRGQAKAFKLDTLLKLADVKGTDGKTTLLHFVVQEITRSEGSGDEPAAENPSHSTSDEQFRKQSLTVVAGLSSELGNVRKAAGMDSDVLSSYVSKLETGLQKIKSVLQVEKPCTQDMKFFEMMEKFLEEAEKEIGRVKAEEKRVMNLVKETTEYFHGDAAKEEAHPLRIFVVVRDFLSVLDNVCKEVGKMHERTVMGSARSFRIYSCATLPVLQRYARQGDDDSDQESSTS